MHGETMKLDIGVLGYIGIF